MEKLTYEQEVYLCEIIGKWYSKWENKLIDKFGNNQLGRAKEDLKDMICNRDEDFVDDFAHLSEQGENFRLVNKIGLALSESLRITQQYNEQRNRLVAIYNNNNFVYTKELEEEVDKISEYIKKTNAS
jgi:hypothetical protein